MTCAASLATSIQALSAAATIRQRRTHKQFGGAPLTRAELAPLLELASWAPMHRLTNPWRFGCLTQEHFPRLADWLQGPAGNVLAAETADPAKAMAKMAKFCSHYLPQLGAIIQVTSLVDADPLVTAENRDAVAAAVQNLLLGAEEAGLAAFWASSTHLQHPHTLTFFGADPASEAFVASVWLGSRVREPTPPARAELATLTRWL